ncbi:hypothetical protein K491DRAFT_347814 [Lophiostoma macrostomum CBS 122681]|uniref:Uncharacterized protein n=1 Tax=Lophiostoma macrostomum CBS 122681 TaxID=1314788 RepID=A0A6A6TCK5_9PLEO|nr:hypothetical protein K491DRAFT_347814 [Lophiostoma macrostomum CBS 122681]
MVDFISMAQILRTKFHTPHAMPAQPKIKAHTCTKYISCSSSTARRHNTTHVLPKPHKQVPDSPPRSFQTNYHPNPRLTTIFSAPDPSKPRLCIQSTALTTSPTS